MGTFDFLVFEVILRSLGALTNFSKIRFSKSCFFYTYDTFSTKFCYVFPVTVHVKFIISWKYLPQGYLYNTYGIHLTFYCFTSFWGHLVYLSQKLPETQK